RYRADRGEGGVRASPRPIRLLTTRVSFVLDRIGQGVEFSDALGAGFVHVDVALRVGGESDRIAHRCRGRSDAFTVVAVGGTGERRDDTRGVHHTDSVVVAGGGDCGCCGRMVGGEQVA